MLDKKTNRLIEINVWCAHLLIFLLPISFIAIGSPIYALYKIEEQLNFEANVFSIIKSIYQNSSSIQRLSWFILPTVICIYFFKWSAKKLKD